MKAKPILTDAAIDALVYLAQVYPGLTTAQLVEKAVVSMAETEKQKELTHE